MSSVVRAPRPLNLSALSILVVDDQPFFRVLVTEVLRSLGITKITLAVDGEDGFNAFIDTRPDVVITDWMMPKFDGIGLTKRIRDLSDERLQQVPVILVTARSERSQIDFARGAGIDEFILKPISAKSVCDRLREVIEKPRPFISLQIYTGPCRRRRSEANFTGPYRRFNDPFEIEGHGDDDVAEGLRSVFSAASARVTELVKGLAKSNANIRPIHLAVGEMQEIAEDLPDANLERVCELLRGYLVAMNKSGKSSPSLIEAHLNAMEILLRTPVSQSKTRDEIVMGLERMMKRPNAA